MSKKTKHTQKLLIYQVTHTLVQNNTCELVFTKTRTRAPDLHSY